MSATARAAHPRARDKLAIKFTDEAREYVKRQLGIKIVLIDGKELMKLMIEYNLGVSVSAVYEVKCIDSDYFA